MAFHPGLFCLAFKTWLTIPVTLVLMIQVEQAEIFSSINETNENPYTRVYVPQVLQIL